MPPPVPTTYHVIAGAAVNIVLKADQGTGRTVAGTVATVLTRGNHPRGIKVRLADGRVGRVQSMADPNSIGTTTSTAAPTNQPSSSHAARQDRHDRSSGGIPPPAQPLGLDAYIKPPRKSHRGRRSTNAAASSSLAHPSAAQGYTDMHMRENEPTPEMFACPVCGDYEGDAAAVAHHVGTHFDE